MSSTILWLAVAILLGIVEIFTATIGIICFSVGAVGAAAASYFGLNVMWQWGIFIVVSMLSFAFVRPLLMRLLNNNEVKTNADAIIGRRVKVSETIDVAAQTGRVSVDGDSWKAVSVDGSTIEQGTEVEIVSRNSIVLTVKN